MDCEWVYAPFAAFRSQPRNFASSVAPLKLYQQDSKLLSQNLNVILS
jgi:hypothetical protein